MDLDEIARILELMREHALAEFELERDGTRLRLRMRGNASMTAPVRAGVASQPAAPPPAARPPVAVPVLDAAEQDPSAAVSEDLDFAIVKSPIVGTFYTSHEPGVKPFAVVGQKVTKGEVLCIIEAMKLMNEINAECDGEVVQAYVENGQAVQYGERLFAIRPA